MNSAGLDFQATDYISRSCKHESVASALHDGHLRGGPGGFCREIQGASTLAAKADAHDVRTFDLGIRGVGRN